MLSISSSDAGNFHFNDYEDIDCNNTETESSSVLQEAVSSTFESVSISLGKFERYNRPPALFDILVRVQCQNEKNTSGNAGSINISSCCYDKHSDWLSFPAISILDFHWPLCTLTQSLHVLLQESAVL